MYVEEHTTIGYYRAGIIFATLAPKLRISEGVLHHMRTIPPYVVKVVRDYTIARAQSGMKIGFVE